MKGQALAEFALVTPPLLLLLLGAADVGTLALERAVAQNGATTIAALVAQGIPSDDDATVTHEVERACPDGTLVLLWSGSMVTASLTCHHVSLTSLLPDSFTVQATSVAPATAPEESPVP